MERSEIRDHPPRMSQRSCALQIAPYAYLVAFDFRLGFAA